MTDSHDVADLTFVTRNAKGTLNLWTPERSGDHATDCGMGRDYAAELLLFMRTTDNPAIFGAVLRAMARPTNAYGSVEVGFSAVIGIKLAGIDPDPIPAAVMPVRPVSRAA